MHRVLAAVLALALGACSQADPVAVSSTDAPTASTADDGGSIAPPTVTSTGDTVGTTLAFAASSLPPGTTVCDRFEQVTATASVASDHLTEVSGIAVSRTHEGIIWAHNDSGDDAAVYAVGTDGGDEGRWVLDGVAALDWEDVALGPGRDPGRDDLYLADIGDNFGFRPEVMVYRIGEPDPSTPGVVADVERLRLTYPTPGADAEALAVDPITGDLYVLTKDDGSSVVYRARAATLTDPIISLEPVAELDLGPGASVTGADFTQDGTVIGVRGYDEVWLFHRTEGDAAAAFDDEPCAAPSPDERQGEAFSFIADGSAYVTVSEGDHQAVNVVTAGG